MIVAPFPSCRSSGKREPVYECAWRPSFRPAHARAADVVPEAQILVVGTELHRGTVLAAASTIACRRKVLPMKARFDGFGGYGELGQP